MRVVRTEEIGPDTLSPFETYQVYNGLDCALTVEIYQALQPFRTPQVEASYQRTLSLQAPAIHMMLRGFKIDQWRRQELIDEFSARLARLQRILDRFADAMWSKPLNPNSPAQMKAFFYEYLRLPPQSIFVKGERKISTNRECLERLRDYHHPRPIINVLLAMRDCIKSLGVLRTGVDDDGRLRTSYNICGTETYRWSSSGNCWGTGTNLQNITGDLRSIFEADPGWKLAYVDLEQAESRVVAYLSGDEEYIQACESGDLHTTVCRLVWRNDLPWTGDVARDKKLADGSRFYRTYTYRDLAKRGGHGTNYYGKPATIARHLHITQKIAEEFQHAYFEAFPGIRRWHREVAQELQLTGKLATPMGRVRHFFGRLRDDATLRKAIAFVPQSTIGDVLNEGLRKVYERFDLGIGHAADPNRIQMLGQVHDAFIFQYREDDEREIIPLVLEQMTVPVTIRGRTMVIPSEAQVGWNWDKVEKDKQGNVIGNPSGLVKFPRGGDTRQRTQTLLLDRRFR